MEIGIDETSAFLK